MRNDPKRRATGRGEGVETRALIAAVLISGSTCMRSSTEGERVEPRSQGPWSVDGIPLGATYEQAIAELGEPRKDDAQGNRRIVTWPPPKRTFVAFDGAGKAVEVAGRTLEDATGRTVLWSSAGEQQVREVLGEVKRTESYRPRGDVISCQRVLVGVSLELDDGRTHFSISLVDDSIRSIIARPIGFGSSP